MLLTNLLNRQIPSFLKGKDLLIYVEKGTINGNTRRIAFHDARTNALLYSIEFSMHTETDLLQEYVALCLKELGLTTRNQYGSLQELQEVLTEMGKVGYTFNAEEPATSEPDLEPVFRLNDNAIIQQQRAERATRGRPDRPVPVRRQPRLRAPRVANDEVATPTPAPPTTAALTWGTLNHTTELRFWPPATIGTADVGRPAPPQDQPVPDPGPGNARWVPEPVDEPEHDFGNEEG